METYKIMKDEINIIQEKDINGNIINKEIRIGYIQRQSDLALIPCTEANSDYLKYLEDIKNGATVTNFDYIEEDARLNNASIEVQKQLRIEEIKQELNNLDLKAIRPLLEGETARVEEIKNQKILLRTELAALLTFP